MPAIKRVFQKLVTQACTVVALCATVIEMDTSNIAVTDSKTALDLNIGSCIPVMYCRV